MSIIYNIFIIESDIYFCIIISMYADVVSITIVYAICVFWHFTIINARTIKFCQPWRQPPTLSLFPVNKDFLFIMQMCHDAWIIKPMDYLLTLVMLSNELCVFLFIVQKNVPSNSKHAACVLHYLEITMYKYILCAAEFCRNYIIEIMHYRGNLHLK